MEKISINVGGSLFHVLPDTLCKCPYFEAMLRGLPTTRVPFIDRDARAFQHILSLLQNPGHDVPAKYRHELAFYGLEPETSERRYWLPSDLMRLPYAERGQQGPVQLVPIHQAVKIEHRPPDKYMQYFMASFHYEAYQALKACGGCEFLGNELDVMFSYNEQTDIFVQTAETQFRLTPFKEFVAHFQASTTQTYAVPVISSLSTPSYNCYCYALLVVTPFMFHRFRGLPPGAALDASLSRGSF